MTMEAVTICVVTCLKTYEVLIDSNITDIFVHTHIGTPHFLGLK